MTQHRPLMMPRDGAGKIDLVGGTGPLKHMTGLPTFMEFFKIDTTFQGQSPDSIDPGRTKPDVPWAWRISDDAGYSNEIVARVFIQCAEALNNKTLKRGDENKIKVALHTCKEDLRNCEKAFLRLLRESKDIEQAIKNSGGVKIEKGVVNNLPQIPNLEHDATIFLTSSKRALQSIADVLNEFYGISINNARFDKGIIQLKKLNPSPTYLLEFLDKCTATVNRILDLRNFQDHTPKKTVVKNFHITANGLFPPTWQVVPETEKPILPEMHELLGSLIELAEIAFFHSLMDNLAGPFANAYIVEEIPLAERKDGSAIRFRCELTLIQRKSGGTSEVSETPAT
jgi:hypothetical protein